MRPSYKKPFFTYINDKIIYHNISDEILSFEEYKKDPMFNKAIPCKCVTDIDTSECPYAQWRKEHAKL